MKLTTLINSALIIASMTLIPGIASAQTTSNNNNGSYLQPFNIVFLAYQGYLKGQGIPSMGTLLYQYQIGKVTAKDVVEAGVKANKLPAEVINDEYYLSAVELQLSSLGNSNELCN
ncbi:hypothetical protein H1Q63_16970 [Desmonostoc muscorum CCALA 125]|uniref:Uncharacterized protein n=1 Tax=Desmonostoc muscorum LEGE 12446 TaxID=1828758 RepID=A0A8J6ZVW4_DESMC|nr:hypothetical protein [Desmonostoc muscorum]MBX9255602.1 hypothetical protein [Desmonostoc muscorum CCALA 125]MCF2146403.1 hypothetical protein [Desmonostoc muscorum LEGE 12446]